jgi:hypothetical protein
VKSGWRSENLDHRLTDFLVKMVYPLLGVTCKLTMKLMELGEGVVF